MYKLTNEEAWFELGDALGVERPDSSKPTRPDIEMGLVAHYHRELMDLTGPLRDVLATRRGFTDDTLKRFQLGWNGDRVTIPIYDEHNTLVNFRLYKWNSDNDQYKLTNYTDELGNTYGEVRIFGIENLVNDDIVELVWSEGETDRIMSEQHGFPTACPTSGAGSWRNEWSKLFRAKKRVYICQDNDEAGRIASKKIAEKISRVCEAYIVKWPEDYPEKGDITDWYVKMGHSAEDFKKLLESAERYIDPRFADSLAEEGEALEVSLAESADAKLFGKRIQIPVMVSGKDTTPFIVPKTVVASCGDAANGDNPKCQVCNMCSHGGEMSREFNTRDRTIMKLVNSSEEQMLKGIALSMGINVKCNVYNLDVTEHMNVEDIRMIPKADTGFGFAAVNDYVVRNGMFVGNNLKPNKRYTMLGYMYPDPTTQQASYLFDRAVPEKDLLSEFEITEETIEELKIFQVKEGETIEDKFNEIHTDLERNVTYVWERRDVGIAVDLIYHTALHFYFQNQFVKRGWGELLIIGDSGQAKSTLVERIMSHYRAGELHSGESSKRTGLVYSIQQNSKRWFLVWGAFPLNDGGLITLDELSGLPEDDLAVMSDVRSSGIAKSTGVITSETTARTRAIYISNPRNGRQLNTETHGVNAILKLFGKTEDVRRLDMAMAVASGDVDPTIVNKSIDDMPKTPHKYTSDLCNTRVLWAWSRRPDQIKFEPEAEKAILSHATDMGRRYSSKVPIVEAADQRIKIARLAIACAACVFSTNETHEHVVVKEEHVDFVVKFMDRIYSTKSLGYDKMSEIELAQSDASTNSISKIADKFMIIPTQDHNELVDALYQLPYFNRNTLEDYTGMDRDDLRMLLKFLTSNHLVEKVRSDYRRMPLGTEFLEYMRANRVTPEVAKEARKRMYNSEY